jgi:hypothetical protein
LAALVSATLRAKSGERRTDPTPRTIQLRRTQPIDCQSFH